jgi:hypothetical protein
MIVAEKQSSPGGQTTPSVCSFALGKIILAGGMEESCYAALKYVIAMANLTISVPFHYVYHHF